MARHNQATNSIHAIIRRNAYYNALFFFVDGYMSADNRLTPREAVLIFRSRYCTDGDPDADVRMYNRMRSEYLSQNNVFTDDKNNCNTPDQGNGNFFPKSLGVVG